MAISSEMVSLDELHSCLFVYRGGFARILEYSEVELAMALLVVRSDREEEVGRFVLSRGDVQMPVYGRKGQYLGDIAASVELTVAAKKQIHGQMVNNEIVNRGELSPVE